MGLVPIVEGKGETSAIRILLRRILEHCGTYHVRVEKPIRISRDRMMNKEDLERAIRLARAKTDSPCLLIVRDADDDCPAVIGPKLLSMAREIAGARVPVGVAVAKREYEAWFLAALDELRGKRRIRPDAMVPQDPEGVRGAKEYLQSQMLDGEVYSPTVDQPALTSLLDLDRARDRSPSFDKLWREVERVVRECGENTSSQSMSSVVPRRSAAF